MHWLSLLYSSYVYKLATFFGQEHKQKKLILRETLIEIPYCQFDLKTWAFIVLIIRSTLNH